ncbi:VOC family protein [Natrarchaeobius chitinivorans]|uniref:VOC family protein n=1 Tax=Natrarchaeobius chitinivorans TaxID=1679083 RepID=A0A3N6PCA9_NATCH|nr:VOC family protein [Natrarchaeobius chitinivorans]RQG94375.1 VOC family protein [Natrarchaeobius chitinivorans]
MTERSADHDHDRDTDEPENQPRLVGINHVALEVGDVDAALEFYESIFTVELRGRSETKAFVDMGDQFIALAETDGATDEVDDARHFGLVVDDANRVDRRLETLDIDRLDVPGLEFRDPWGNRVQIVDYEEIQFTKADHVLRGMGLDGLEKSDEAIDELEEKGLGPD